MRKVVLYFSIFAILLVACQVGQRDNFLPDDKNLSVACVLDKAEAMLIAQQEVFTIASEEKSCGWTQDSKVIDAFEIFLDGVEGVSYYECKVMTNDKDAGYILVNINDTDFTFVEACETGLTLTEQYEKMTNLPKEEFEVYRYGYFESAVFEKLDRSEAAEKEIASRGGRLKERKIKPLASIGFENVNTFDFNEYRNAIKKNKGSFFSEKGEEKIQSVASRGMTGKGNAETELKGCWGRVDGKKYVTPPWFQFNVNYKIGKPQESPGSEVAAVGCGPTALAIVLSYWQVVKGKNNLFDTSSSTLFSWYDERIRDNVCDIWRIVKTFKKKNMGATYIPNMLLVRNYINPRGYNCTVQRKNGTYDPKFNMIYDALEGDRPVIMVINDSGIGLPTHYVVIEKAERQSKVSDSYIRYFCNYGWGGVYKWVYAFNQRPVSENVNGIRCSTYEIIDINIY